MLRVDGGGTRDTEEDEDVITMLVNDTMLEELEEGVGIDKKTEEVVEAVAQNDNDELEDMLAGISLLPSSSSSESGA